MIKTEYHVDSKEWYETPSQAAAYLALMETGYSGGIVRGEDALLEDLVEVVAKQTTEKRQYIDLGPGNGKKTATLARALHERQLLEHYVAVDIQPQYIEIARNIVSGLRIETAGFAGSFETFLDMFRSQGNNFVYLGATFCNMDAGFDKMLHDALHKNDLIYVSSALFPENIEETVAQYRGAIGMFEHPATKRGISIAQPEVQFNHEKNQVEVGFIDRDIFHVFGISQKPTRAQFEERVAKKFEGTYLCNDTHIGFVGHPK